MGALAASGIRAPVTLLLHIVRLPSSVCLIVLSWLLLLQPSHLHSKQEVEKEGERQRGPVLKALPNNVFLRLIGHFPWCWRFWFQNMRKFSFICSKMIQIRKKYEWVFLWTKLIFVLSTFLELKYTTFEKMAKVDCNDILFDALAFQKSFVSKITQT